NNLSSATRVVTDEAPGFRDDRVGHRCQQFVARHWRTRLLFGEPTRDPMTQENDSRSEDTCRESSVGSALRPTRPLRRPARISWFGMTANDLFVQLSIVGVASVFLVPGVMRRSVANGIGTTICIIVAFSILALAL